MPGEDGRADQHHVRPEALCQQDGQVVLPLEVLHHTHITAQGRAAADLLGAVEPPAGGDGDSGEDGGEDGGGGT